ncbi:nitroreductase family protein [Trichomonas vaginalis G3]|uniref:Nitroreductase family protein n=1 Tax=Trichomonas vaginalis (strain ATCC PRA-98 / G3) TaxID=412133 RepID=A2FZU5_TRIV3|nr:nitroreductase family protein [Trichomonas vaginalis G3]EAX89567.1 nitroreductase family protein [Trichomonas vaginalis G3]KAI5507559.1 nitroreductase family protein [Trichomonas vaginalis G3]|eukprot:XP_001302497.1 nitroreductase family protein [Trichomonas vaginalis G3]
MSVLKCIQGRRTIRSYVKDFEIPKKDIDLIANAGLTAPSSMDIQGVDIVVVTNKEKLAQISDATFKGLPEPGQKHFQQRINEWGVKNPVTCDAPVLYLFVKNERAHKDYVQIDCGLIVESMILLAADMSYSTMTIGAVALSDLSEVLNIPKGGVIVGLAMGKAAPDLKLPERQIKGKITHID